MLRLRSRLGLPSRTRRVKIGASAGFRPSTGGPAPVVHPEITDIFASTDSVQAGFVGTFASLVAAGGTEPIVFSKASGPAWLTIQPSGAVVASGAQAEGAVGFVALATDATGKTYSETITIGVSVAPVANPAPLPPGDAVVTAPVDPAEPESGFTFVPVSGSTSTGTKLSGKSAGTAAFLFDVGPPVPGAIYTMRYSADWSGMKRQGRESAVGFAMKAGNNFHLSGPRADGANPASMLRSKVFGNFAQASAFTRTNDGSLTHATLSGDNWLRASVSSDGLSYTLSSSPDGAAWADQYVAALPSPTARMDGVLQFGPGAYFSKFDSGAFAVLIEYWHVQLPGAIPVNTTPQSVYIVS